MKLKDKRVLITGGASGIGKIMARLMLEKNAQVVLWDINQPNLDATLMELSKLGSIVGYQVDVSNINQIKQSAKQVKEEVGKINVLINNAGIVVGKYFHQHSTKDITNTMDINANAPMYITAEFLNDMLEDNIGHICNIASSAGLIGNPKMSVYAASKWSLVGWSESLRLEMVQLGKNVQVTTVMPYYINTGMFDGVQSKIPIQDPEKAAQKIVKAIENNTQRLTIPGFIFRFTRLGQALMPNRIFDWFAGKVLGIYDTMENFKGRN
ncbi:SDR family NAD(P)-dependent oxidoreductase [Flavobacteriaceae bacterium Ap0902]|nr:SDR family NAD(P)-dependent oxidoreductase [Flavobacteriaceae bacterium Ap0902]